MNRSGNAPLIGGFVFGKPFASLRVTEVVVSHSPAPHHLGDLGCKYPRSKSTANNFVHGAGCLNRLQLMREPTSSHVSRVNPQLARDVSGCYPFTGHGHQGRTKSGPTHHTTHHLKQTSEGKFENVGLSILKLGRQFLPMLHQFVFQ